MLQPMAEQRGLKYQTGPVAQPDNMFNADQQIIKWYAPNQVLVGTDGGIFYSSNGGATFSDRNAGLRIKQFFFLRLSSNLIRLFFSGSTG